MWHGQFCKYRPSSGHNHFLVKRSMPYIRPLLEGLEVRTVPGFLGRVNYAVGSRRRRAGRRSPSVTSGRPTGRIVRVKWKT
jgi:hypothetical protein